MVKKNIHKIHFLNAGPAVLIGMFLVVSTLTVYWQVRNHGFVNFDDDKYISENRNIRDGLSLEGIDWAFSLTHKDDRYYWHPLTWLSHMLDCQLYGLRPGMHHLTSLALHIVNTLLLFIVLKRMTKAVWKSAFVAALFALHPLNVDSVAWAAERKNVLSTFFWMLTMVSYIYYIKRPGLYRYMFVLSIFGLGLLAKPMLVTLPFVLLLLDYWPLGRLGFGKSSGEKQLYFLVVLEKVPLLALSAVSIYLSSSSLKQAEALISTESVPMNIRFANALVSYISYIGKMIWPHNLAVFYPFPDRLPLWQVAAAGFLLISVTFLMIRPLKRRPYLGIGWLWYFGTLLPVIGLVQGGLWPAMADRWAYVPLIGLFIIIAWGVPELVARWHYRRTGVFTIASISLVIVMATTWLQVRYWNSSITLFEHALDVTENNHLGHYNLGVALAGEGRSVDAIKHYTEALQIDPEYIEAHNNLGLALAGQGRTAEAIRHYSEALRIDPDHVSAFNNLGVALAGQGRTAEAMKHYTEALRIDPDHVPAHNNLGLALIEQGRTAEAIRHYTEALRIDPGYIEAHNNLGLALVKQGRTAEAIRHYTEALRIEPGYIDAHNNLGNVLRKQGKISEALSHYDEVLRINPDSLEAHSNIGNTLLEQGRVSDAINHFSEVLRIDPDSAEVHNNLGAAFLCKGEVKSAIDHFQKAVGLRPDYTKAQDNLKEALVAQEKIEAAFASVQEEVRLNPGNPALHYKLGHLYQKKGELHKAIDRYEKALAIQPGFAEALKDLAMVHVIRRDYDKAIFFFKKIIGLRPDSAGVYYNIACIYALQNKKEESIAWLKEAIERGYENWNLIKTDKDLENIRDSSYFKEIIRGR